MSENTGQPRWLNADQEARAEGLRIAREVLRSGGGPFTSGRLEVYVPELVDVAEYVVTGTHPLDRYTDEWSWPGDEQAEGLQPVLGQVGGSEGDQ